MYAIICVSGIPSGGIIKWSGTIANIPTGFVLCDGNNGTPNLTDKFIIGAGNTYDPGDTAGAASHSHTVNQSGHCHVLAENGDIAAGSDYAESTDTIDPAITCSTEGTIPPCYALAFIMKT